jgi:Mg-chelatase subunit ChlD
MSVIHLARPWVLLLAIPVVAAALAPALRRRGRRPGAAGRAVFGSIAAGLLLVALAGPSVRVGERGAHLAVAEDASASMRIAGAQLGPENIECRIGAARLRVVAFADETFAGTSVAEALREAARALPRPEGVVLLYSDGRETEGDARTAAAEIAARGIQVHTLVPELEPVADARITSITSPTDARPRQAIRIRIGVASTVANEVRLGVSRPAVGDLSARTWNRSIDVVAGLGSTVAIEDVAPAGGTIAYRAEISARGDTVPENDTAALLLQIGAPRSVVCVHGGQRPSRAARWLQDALPPGIRLRTVSADEGLPQGPNVAVMVLDNLPARESLAAEPARRLAARVRDGGLGLLVLGGDAAFGAGGYADSPLDAVLPVETLTERRPIRLVLAIDASGSMNETFGGVRKLSLATQAVLALRPALDPHDRVGVVAFASEPRRVSPLRPVAEWAELRRALLGVQAGGGTRITPALEAAREMLPDQPPDEETARHVLLLSDGRSEDFQAAYLAAAFREAGVTVSAVATGEDARRAELRRLAEATGGRLYVETDLARLGETFLEDLARARGEGMLSGPLRAAWRSAQPVWTKTAPPLPPVPAWNPTTARPEATVHWIGVPQAAAPGSDGPGEKTDPPPLLASWRVGLGAAAAMPWPVADAPEAWRTEADLPRRLADVVLWLRGPHVPPGWSARLLERGGRRLVRATLGPAALEEEAPAFVATVFRGGVGEPQRVEMEQVEPGIFEASLGPARGPAASVVVGRTGREREHITLAAPGLPPAEFDAFGVDRRRLEEIARAGGGRLHTSLDSVLAVLEAIERRGYRAVGWYFAWAGAAAGVLLVVLRLAGRL